MKKVIDRAEVKIAITEVPGRNIISKIKSEESGSHTLWTSSGGRGGFYQSSIEKVWSDKPVH